MSDNIENNLMEYGAEPINSAENSSGECRRRRHSTIQAEDAEVPIKRPRLTPEPQRSIPTWMWCNVRRLNFNNYRPMCPIIEISAEHCDNEEMDINRIYQEGDIVDDNRDEQNMEE